MIADNAQIQVAILAVLFALLVGVAGLLWRRSAGARIKQQASRRPAQFKSQSGKVASTPPMGLDGQWVRIHDFSRATLSRTEHMLELQAAATQKVEATEYALASLRHDLAGVTSAEGNSPPRRAA